MLAIKNLYELLVFSNEMINYLKIKGVIFDDDGFPIFKKEWFLNKWPDAVVTYYNRNNILFVKDKKKTLLCMFSSDVINYRRLANIYNEILEYQQFMGVIGLDITITEDMDKEWQRYVSLVNQLFLCVLAVNEIKIVLNTRCECGMYYEHFKNIPKGIMVASSSLGCKGASSEIDSNKYINKILFLLPDKLLLYGKKDEVTEEILSRMGISYRRFEDFHTLSKEIYKDGF